MPDWSKVFNQFGTDELELWNWSGHVFLHKSPLPVRTALHHPWLIHLGASCGFKVSIPHIFGHAFNFLFILSGNITLIHIIILAPRLVEILQSFHEFAPSDPNHFTFCVPHRVVFVVLWKIKVTYVLVYKIPALHQPASIILIRKLHFRLFDTYLTKGSALAWNVFFQSISVQACTIKIFAFTINWLILFDRFSLVSVLIYCFLQFQWKTLSFWQFWLKALLQPYFIRNKQTVTAFLLIIA